MAKPKPITRRTCSVCNSDFWAKANKVFCSSICYIKKEAQAFCDAPAQRCWEWTKSVNPQTGYGHFTFTEGKARLHTAHRAAYREFNGEIPEGLLVCHTCDNRKCFNPAHLFAGTQKQNLQDAKSKKRLPYRRSLDLGTLALIKKSNLPTREIAAIVGMSAEHISIVRTGHAYGEGRDPRYKHIGKRNLIWVVHGTLYETLDLAAADLKLCRATVDRWCSGYKHSGKTYPPKDGCYKIKRPPPSVFELYTTDAAENLAARLD